ncbi:uncharacterized protein LOC108110059 isoform X2 [Drosophila eugracilis]|nr:uncharacterized protein LOC108110059 isoform X2 [Drosophila eugracilis]
MLRMLTHTNMTPKRRLVKELQEFENTDIFVIVNDHAFLCHSTVLCFYSKVMLKIIPSCCGHIVFKTPELSQKGFSDLYNWMISTQGTLDILDFADLMRSAFFLEVNELIELCWKTLDTHLFDEFSAFSVMYESRKASELMPIFKKMSDRIARSTLAITCSQEFLSLSEVQICGLLQSNTLSVNSEMELLYGTLKWLIHCWPQRSSSITTVMKDIRYGYLPPTMLTNLKSSDPNNIGPFVDIVKVISESPDIRTLIRDGLFYSSLIIACANDPSCIENNIEFSTFKLLDHRNWIRDKNCEYHRPVTRKSPNMRYVTFKQYQNYLQTLISSGREFDKFLEYPDDEEYAETNPAWLKRRKIDRMLLCLRTSYANQSWYIKDSLNKIFQQGKRKQLVKK